METPAPNTRQFMKAVNSLLEIAPRDARIVNGVRANILIVDDRDDKLLVFRTVLEELNQNLVTMQSGADALRWLLDNDCAVILLDVDMPGMDGFETAHLIRMRPRSSHIPIIFITGYSDEMHTARGFSLGSVDYILSPVVPNILRSKVAVFVQLFNLTEQTRKKADEHIALAREQAARAAAEAATRRASFLAEASKILSRSLDVDSLMAGATQLLVPVLADFSAMTLGNGAGSSATQTACAPLWNPEDLHNAIVHDPAWFGAIDQVLATGQQKIIVKHSFDVRNPP